MADEKLTSLTVVTPDADALIYGINDPGGTPVSRAFEASAVGVIHHQRKILTDAQVLGLPDSGGPVEAVAGVPGKIIAPIFAMFQLDWTADYADIGATCLFGLFLDGNLNTLNVFSENGPAAGTVSGILAFGANAVGWLSPDAAVSGSSVFGISGQADTDLVGLPLDVAAFQVGDFTGGDPANRLIVDIFYVLIDAP